MLYLRFREPIRARAAAISLACAIVIGLSARAGEIPSTSQTRAAALREHARYLASEELTGRGVDTPGITLARDYIAREFASYGLQPAGDDGSYLQGFDVTTGVAVNEPTSLVLGDHPPLKVEREWIPLALSGSGKVEAELVFAGYGITAKEYGYDDYAGIDAKGKIVLVLRYEPPPKNDRSPFQKPPRYSRHAALRTKAINARDHGAVGMILVDLNHSEDPKADLISLKSGLWRGGNNIVAAQISRSVLEKWPAAQAVSLKSLKDEIDRHEKPASKILPSARVSLQVNLAEARQRTENVVAVLPGSDPKLKDEAIVIGAHYDHLGFGHFGTREPGNEGRIHYGADDNASGTAVLLQVAQRLGSSQPAPARTIVFAAFSAEELGLHGSRRYVAQAPFPLASTKTMINLDMVGRLRDRRLTVFGARSAQELSGIIGDAARQTGLEINESDGVGRSDHISFYNKSIPVLHFFSGSHPDYHRPSDTWDKLNIEGMAKISDLLFIAVLRLANTRAPMQFVSLPSRPPGGESAASRGYGAYLGSIPDLGGNEDGVRLAGVSEGSPAALAGLREGDVIVQFGDAQIQNLQDLTDQLRRRQPGDEVDITVRRGNKAVALKAVLRSRG
jgi:aminopeptidase YwaD